MMFAEWQQYRWLVSEIVFELQGFGGSVDLHRIHLPSMESWQFFLAMHGDDFDFVGQSWVNVAESVADDLLCVIRCSDTLAS